MTLREELTIHLIEAQRLKAGGVPDPVFLVEAPLLDEWWVNAVDGGYRTFSGTCIGHPTFGDGPLTTTIILTVPKDLSWMLTTSRYYRLGNPKYLDDEMKAELAEIETKRLKG